MAEMVYFQLGADSGYAAVADSLQEFQKGYKPDGYYRSNPQKYQRDNVNALDHFIRCLSSTKTKKLNVSLTDTERDAITRWIRSRYACEGA